MTITKCLWTEFSSIQFWERQRLKGKRDKAISSVTFDLLKSAIISCVHDHNIFILFPNLSLNPLSPHLSTSLSIYPTTAHILAWVLSFHSIPFKFGVLFCLSFSLFYLSPFFSLSLYIWLPWEQSGPLQRACVTWHPSHQRHQQAL